MLLNVLGCTRTTLMQQTSPSAVWQPTWKRVGNLLNLHRDEDRRLQLFSLNEECLEGTSHQLVLITSLPFVHTARRCY